MRRRAYTLIELIVYLGIFLLVVLTVGAVYSILTQTQNSTAATYAVTGDGDTAVQYFRRDLEETALASVRVYSSSSTQLTELRPALSFCSPRIFEPGKPGSLQISEYGAPRWVKHVFYALDSRSGEGTGNLVRWEAPFDSGDRALLPRIALFPKQIDRPTAHILLHNVVVPNRPIEGVPLYKASPWGGFRTQFVRRPNEYGEDSLSDENPSLNRVAAADNTRLLEIELAICDETGGKPNYCSFKFRVNVRF